jgi:hypothetical protein
VLLQVLEASASEEASGENNANTVRKPGADRLERCVFLGGWACLKMVKYIYIGIYIHKAFTPSNHHTGIQSENSERL